MNNGDAKAKDGGEIQKLLLCLLVLDGPDTLPLLRHTRRTTLASRLVDDTSVKYIINAQ